MVPPPQFRVLRCHCCRLFQTHQVKKSLKWTCRACGERQSFLRAYGEGSGADCRRHVQKLNLLQGQVSEMSLRRWIQSPVQPLCSPASQDLGHSGVTLETQKDPPGLAGKVREGGGPEGWDDGELTGPYREPRPAQQVTAMSSKWERFLLPPGNCPDVDTEPLTPLQRGSRPARATQAEQGTPSTQTPGEGGLGRVPGPFQLPWAPHTPTSGSQRPFRETPEHLWGTSPQRESGPLVKGAEKPPLVQLCDLFNTGEDFDDNL